MTTNEYAGLILQVKKEASIPQEIDENAAYEGTEHIGK